MKVIVRDRNGNIIPDDKLKETVLYEFFFRKLVWRGYGSYNFILESE